MEKFKDRVDFLIKTNFSNKASVFSEKTKIDEGTISTWRTLDTSPNITKRTEKKIESVNINPNWLFYGIGDIVLRPNDVSFSELITKYDRNSVEFVQFKNAIENAIKNKYKSLEIFYNDDSIDFRFKDIVKSQNFKDPYFTILIFEYFPKFNPSKTLLNIISDIESISTDIQEVSVDPKATEQLLNMPVYDLPVHANVGVGHNFEDLPMSYKPMNFGMKLDPLSAKVFRVSGDSMRDARIFNGAYIVIDTKLQPTNHSEVLANHNGVLIVKHYEQAEAGFKLYSQNGGMHEYQIADTDYLDIIGVVRLVFNYR